MKVLHLFRATYIQTLMICCLFFTKSEALCQVYTIPTAEIQPQWVFPLWIEDGYNRKDTLYFAYDENASNGLFNIDSLFGEYIIDFDTSTFNALWAVVPGNRGYKVNVVNSLDVVQLIGFIKLAKLPLKIRFDHDLLYSSILPFIDFGPDVPNAWVEILCQDLPGSSFDNCNIVADLPVIISDTLPAGLSTYEYWSDSSFCFQGQSFHLGDSCFFELGTVFFNIDQWGNLYTSIDNNLEKRSTVKIFPTVAKNKITLDFSFFEVHRAVDKEVLSIFSVDGRNFPIKLIEDHAFRKVIDIRDIPNGMYFILIKIEENQQAIKFIKHS